MEEKYDVIIVGAGPTGIFTAIELVRKAGKKSQEILIIEKGRALDNRQCLMKNNGRHPENSCQHCSSCSVVSGWGGAGAYSDGKLSLSPQIGGNLEQYIGNERLEKNIEYVDEIYREFGAPDRIFGIDEEKKREMKEKAALASLEFIPARLRHLGTGYTRQVLEKMKDYLLEKEVEIKFNTNVIDIVTEAGKISGLKTESGDVYGADRVVIAPGRENSEWLMKLARELGISLAINPVDIGVRVETSAIIARGLTEGIYESKLIYRAPTFDDKVRTFCMSPYGEVVNENNHGLVTVNGHSHADRKTVNTNFALLVSKTFTEPFREPITYGKDIAKLANLLGGGVLIQRLGDLMDGRRSTPERIKRSIVEPTLKEATPGDLSLVLPYRHLKSLQEMLEALDDIAPGIYSRDTLLYGVEVKFYSSQLEVDSNLETGVDNLFVGGDGAGITRGLMQASISGVVIARAILE